ncbi:glycine--tRNA ligase beta subunit [Antarctobacter heliothermus]|uniref:Glycine--tRNA ligase beta subunit n=1 Tax=Antarctobacter heliothermus TaxID=74033 RepID=A0A222E8R8_9RHOB|nr:glycine--tRNA ligase subunit beta [Antarctobacter heliothermus]ASP22609.1 glycine--tRNA ligase beta subunit [Antarctobacter heliothermus]
MPDLLIELFSEEIPARMQPKAAEDLKKLMTDGLVEAGLTYEGAQAFSTPRRLALTVHGLTGQSPTLREERRGPKVGAPDKALEGFMRGAGVTRDQLEERTEKKGSFYYATVTTPGRPAAQIVADVLEQTVRGFPWPKSMRWGTGSLRWVRPLHRIMCLLTDEAGDHPVALNIDGIPVGQTTEGHRFMADGTFDVTSFEDYETRLKRAHVILSAQDRADTIWHDATNMAFAQGMEVVEDPGLLREVAGLVEWPVVLMGDIGAAFLDLPPEVLQTSMKEHQKFFSVKNPSTGRIEKFITVANIETADNGTTILAGNQKVLAARLSDAKFFWENDLRVAKGAGLSAWTERLGNVTFHNKLGSQRDRIARITGLAREIAPMVGADAGLAAQAADVAKADLNSEMVYEFPELQGLMGRYYAQAAGLDASVAAACEDHYAPLGPSDDVPDAPVSVAVALADKLDTLTGFWAIDEKPTGSKDPFALRRAALGVIRLVLENGLRIDLATVIRKADFLVAENEDGVIGPSPDVYIPDLISFIHDRLKVHLRAEGIRHDVIDACLAMDGRHDLALVVKRAQALSGFLATEDGGNLLSGFKRANNILTQAEDKDGVEYSFGADVKFAEVEEERALFTALQAAETRIAPAMAAEEFETAMAAMADLRAPIDAFFEAVQVNADNQIVRRNRLNMLGSIRKTCLQVADLTKIEG